MIYAVEGIFCEPSLRGWVLHRHIVSVLDETSIYLPIYYLNDLIVYSTFKFLS